jgi:hypothetical protein
MPPVWIAAARTALTRLLALVLAPDILKRDSQMADTLVIPDCGVAPPNDGSATQASARAKEDSAESRKTAQVGLLRAYS